MLRLALVGCGSHSENAHARPLAHYAAQHPGAVCLAAACDLDLHRARRFCHEYGFGAPHVDVERMLDLERPDAVVSVLPVEQIAEIGSRLFARRIPCVVEKPPGASIEEARALAADALRLGAPHMVSMNRRFSPYLNSGIGWAAAVGPLRHVRGRIARRGRLDQHFLWGTGVHIVDAVLYAGGELAASSVQRLVCPGTGVPWFLVSLRFASGCTGSVEILPTTGLVDEIVEMHGEGFAVEVRTMGGGGEAVRCWRNGALDMARCADPAEPPYLRDGSYEETAAFIQCVAAGVGLHPTLEEVLPSLVVCSDRS